MAKSIIHKDKSKCFLCGRNGCSDFLEEHHIFFGEKQRELSDSDGLTVYICGERCHRNGKQAVHRCKKTNRMLQRIAQEAWEREYGSREEFMKRYGRNYC